MQMITPPSVVSSITSQTFRYLFSCYKWGICMYFFCSRFFSFTHIGTVLVFLWEVVHPRVFACKTFPSSLCLITLNNQSFLSLTFSLLWRPVSFTKMLSFFNIISEHTIIYLVLQLFALRLLTPLSS